MKIVLWGATGLTGREVLYQALDGGHEVTAVVRQPSNLNVGHDNLTVIRGDILDSSSVAETIAGAEAVMSAVGSGSTFMEARKPTTLYSVGFANIVAAMREHNLRRLVVLVAVGTVPDPNEPEIHKRIIRPILKANYDDIRKAEKNVLATCDDLDWIGIRPMRLMNTPRTGKYRTNYDFLPLNGIEISRADVAELMLKQLHTDENVRRYMTIAY